MINFQFTLLILQLIMFDETRAFISSPLDKSFSTISAWPKSHARLSLSKGDFPTSEDEDEEDWRAFRAKLVSMEQNKIDVTSTQKVSKTWAYDSGNAIEQGTILVNSLPPGGEGKSFGYGLGRQFLHKAVILVLEHEDIWNEVPTRGVILNRPTDLCLYDNDHRTDEQGNPNPEDAWKISFGGNDWGIHTEEPKFYCLHSMNSPEAKQVSREVVKGINFCSFKNAEALVKNGNAKRSDFWSFSGFVSWSPGDLVTDVEKGLWHAISTDSDTIRKGMRILNVGKNSVDPRDGGVRTWTMLMDMIGRGGYLLEQTECFLGRRPTCSFDDLMLREWATRNLLFREAPLFMRKTNEDATKSEKRQEEAKRLQDKIFPGTILRGSSCSSKSRSPFLFLDQEFYKSLVLVIQEDDLTLGLILNHPSTKTIDLTSGGKTANNFGLSAPIRFGGSIGGAGGLNEVDKKPLFVLHMNSLLRQAEVGQPVGENNPSGIWKCSLDAAKMAIAKGIASANDFMFVDGFHIWPKEIGENGIVTGGILEQVLEGNFDIIDQSKTAAVWNTLTNQNVLSDSTLDTNLDLAHAAWNIAGGISSKPAQGRGEVYNSNDRRSPGFQGFVDRRSPGFQGFQTGGNHGNSNMVEKNNEIVFDSDIKVSELGDDAMKFWVMAYLMGELDELKP
eukprot:CAMPEP_0184861520 /NCGR_PEP_ID=MMETSP0580-20130426/6185_1 /TAXON_ID=1118495 /ORGANISM="Dactyliosolen fragilissimus" /LENGTH=671 /DNA_ID=CAMNT_0027359049 /DNA_START=115 /DNA_END=2130 /DNA_ORIENTATION=-